MLKVLALVAALACSPEAQEERITEAIAPTDVVMILDGEQLDLFVKNANELYNIGWQRGQIEKVYVIEAEVKHENKHFQVMHVFFITSDHCIGYYQQVYKAIIELLLLEDPMSKLRPPQ